MAILANPAQLTWTTIAIILGAVAVIVFLVWVMGRIFPSSKKYTAAGGNALLRADVFFRPSREHVLEAKEHEEREDGSSGDPPSH